MKTIIKMFAVGIILFLLGVSVANVNAWCITEEGKKCNEIEVGYNQSYAFYIGGDEKDYENSYVIVQIWVPENIEYFEYLMMTGQCPIYKYNCKLVYLNALLIKRGLDNIY